MQKTHAEKTTKEAKIGEGARSKIEPSWMATKMFSLTSFQLGYLQEEG